MSTAYQEVFGGATIRPSQTTYLRLDLTEDVELSWSLEQQIGGPSVADIIDLNSDVVGLNVDLPDARQSATGPVALFNNIGAETVTVRDAAGVAVVALASGEAWYVYLADNTTEAGTWRTTEFGAGTSVANAATLAGAGLKAISTTLNTRLLPEEVSSTPTTLVDADRAKIKNWTGASGTFNLPNPATVGSDWYVYIRNSGTGNLTLVPPSGTIDGEANKVLAAGDSATVFTNGTNFFTLGFGQTATTVIDFLAINVAGSGDYTLSGNELDKITYRFTGVLTGNRNIIVPPGVQQYWVDNKTSGSFSLTVKTASGSGVTIPQGFSRIVYSDGVNVIAAEGGKVPQPVAEGGTGLTTAVQGDLIYASAADTFSRLSKNTNASRYLSNQGANNNPSWEFVNLANGVTGRLADFTHLPQAAARSVLGVAGSSMADLAAIVAATDGQVLRRSGTSIGFGAVDLSNANAIVNALLVTRGGTGLATVAEGDLLVADGANSLARLARTSPGLRALLNTGTSGNPNWDALRFALANAITGDITLSLDDRWSIKRFALGTAQTVTIPEESSVNFPVGTCIILDTLLGAGDLTVDPDGTVVLKYRNALGSVVIPAGFMAFLVKVGADSWTLFADLPPPAGQLGFRGYVDASATAEKLPSGWSLTHPATGRYVITHNLGLSSPTDLSINATAVLTSFPFAIIPVLWSSALTNNAFEVRTYFDDNGGGGGLADSDFFFSAALVG